MYRVHQAKDPSLSPSLPDCPLSFLWLIQRTSASFTSQCSALGQVPCESCIKRGKPGDCRWDNLDASAGSSAASGQAPYALPSSAQLCVA